MSEGTEYDIFVSYTHEDAEIAKRLADQLASCGWKVFWDRVLLPGMTWRTQIQSALVGAKVVVVVWSQRSVQSRWVEIEADHALQRDAYLPVNVDKAPLPLGFGHVQVADLRDWKAHAGSALPAVLMSALQMRLGPPKTAAAAPPPPPPPPASSRTIAAVNAPAAPPPRPSPVDLAAGAMAVREGIISLTGSGSDGTRYELSIRLSQLQAKPSGLVIGRLAEQADLIVTDGSVSRRHALLIRRDGAITVQDLGSTNGTFVDNRPALPDRPLRLARGAVLRLGEVELLVQGATH